MIAELNNNAGLAEHPILSRSRQFLSAISHLTYDNISLIRPEQKTQLKHKHKSLKTKGGNPPQDYSVSEMIADLEAAVREKNVRSCLVLYLQLSRVFPL